MSVLPVFGSRALPMRVRAGIAFLVTAFFAVILPPTVGAEAARWPVAVVLLLREIVCGLALGLAISFVFSAVKQAGTIAGRQMGFALAEIVDPASGQRSDPIGVFFETIFILFFLVAGGHHLLLLAIRRSYDLFPVGAAPGAGAMAEGLVRAGSTMLLFALKLVAPLLAGTLVLSVVLAVLARAVPEMNVLLISLPLRVGLGLLLAAAIMPLMGAFTDELAGWMNRLLVG